VSDQTICHVDLMATVAALLGVALPPDAGEDSVDLLPILLGEPPGRPVREATVHQAASGKFAIRRGDWVLIDAPSGEDNGRGEPRWLREERGYVAHDQPGELFNLREDLAQRRNRYAERPDIVRALKDILEKSRRDGRSTPGPPQRNDVPVGDGRPVGKAALDGVTSPADVE
jgi:arylsulfatase A-like enzyme